MFLQRLSDYANQIPGTPTLYSTKPIPYFIELDSEGYLLNPEPVSTADPTAKGAKRGKPLLVPHVKRAQGILPLLFADGADYTFGVGSPREMIEKASRDYDKYLARTAQAHAAYLGLVDRCAMSSDPLVLAVQHFLHDDPAGHMTFPDGFDWDGLITFRVNGQFVVDQPTVRSFWAAEHAPKTEGSQAARVMQCIVCGQQRPVLGRLQGNINGLPKGQQAGTALISANKTAFESYGLENSLIAPICATCAERFTNALNHLLADPSHSVRVGDTAFVFWTREPVTWSASSLFAPDATDIRQMLTSPQRGRFDEPEDIVPFYATALTANNARAVVRDWLDTTVGEMRKRLLKWFAAQEIVGRDGDEGGPLPIYTLAAHTVYRDAQGRPKEIPKETVRALVHAAFTGQRVPESLLLQAVRRNRAEGGVTRPRAALIKLVLIGNGTIKEGTLVALESDAHFSTETGRKAYHCGRLLAVLEAIQEEAIRGINTTVGDRFYGTASSSPASVFGSLLRGARANLSTLERDKHYTFERLHGELDNVVRQLGPSDLPTTLNAREQSAFGLGYFLQTAATRAARAAAIAESKARSPKNAPPSDTADSTDSGM